MDRHDFRRTIRFGQFYSHFFTLGLRQFDPDQLTSQASSLGHADS